MPHTYRIIVSTILVETSPQALPLGAACVVSALRGAFTGRADISAIELLSLSAEDNANEETLANAILERCGKDETLIAGFSVYVWNRIVLEKTAALIRKRRPDAVLFAGGPEVTAAPQSFAKDKTFDYLISGEGEASAVSLVRTLLEGRQAERILVSRPAEPETLPSPWLDGVIRPEDYGGALWELSRGCPFTCSYCYESKGERRVRKLPLERLKRELDLFADKDVPQLFVLDPTFNADRERALTILKLLKEKLPAAHSVFEIRAELLDAAQARAFSEISCSVQIGLQSTDPEVLKNIGRSFDKKQFAKKVSLLNEYGVVFGFDLIYGLPEDTLRSFRQSVDFALGLYPNHLELFRLSVLPGTRLGDEAGAAGIKHQDCPPYHVLVTPQFSAEDLRRAEELSQSCGLFYSQGRAVPWFLSVLEPLRLKPSQFLGDFAAFVRPEKYAAVCPHHTEIEKLQLGFLELKYRDKNLAFLFTAVSDIVRLNGALARAAGEGEETLLDLSYNPEDLTDMSALNVPLFVDETCMETCRVRVYDTPDGPEWEMR